ncbi:MAG: hypothetical protein JW947_08060 [Sedimentisphaerales bacterium]|nr:hypothetical protein [Sedimentisphaerales bacterium]
MNTRKNIDRLNQRFHQWEHSLVLSSGKLVHKKEFWPIVVAAFAILCLILMVFFAQKPVTGELEPVPFYPYAD